MLLHVMHIDAVRFECLNGAFGLVVRFGTSRRGQVCHQAQLVGEGFGLPRGIGIAVVGQPSYGLGWSFRSDSAFQRADRQISRQFTRRSPCFSLRCNDFSIVGIDHSVSANHAAIPTSDLNPLGYLTSVRSKRCHAALTRPLRAFIGLPRKQRHILCLISVSALVGHLLDSLDYSISVNRGRDTAVAGNRALIDGCPDRRYKLNGAALEVSDLPLWQGFAHVSGQIRARYDL